MILDFDFDEDLCRVGAVMKDYNIVFWDLNNRGSGHEYEFVRRTCLPELQIRIWFLP